MTDKKNGTIGKKLKKNPWILATFVLAIFTLLVSSVLILENVSADKAGNNLVEFINSQGGDQIEIISGEKYGSNLYEIKVLANGQEIPTHVTQDGKYLVQLLAPLEIEEVEVVEPVKQEPVQGLVKSDKPTVELFVMSHCPFGTQAMKGMIPTVRAFGDEIDFELRFVNYAMHGEKEVREQINMNCIQDEQGDKFLDYLECFLGSGSGSAEEATACRKEVGIDESKLSSCVTKSNKEFDVDKYLADKSARFPHFDVDDALNLEYGVKGSPTLVVNGAQASSGRSSQAYAEVICQSFNEVPGVCGFEFDSANPSSGFGYGTAAAGSTAQCG